MQTLLIGMKMVMVLVALLAAGLHLRAGLDLHHGPPKYARAQRVMAEETHAATMEADVVVIGSGIGGLSAAALLSKYGLRVVVVECA